MLFFSPERDNLPSVPPLSIVVPEEYPWETPIINFASSGYDASEILRKIQNMMKANMEARSDRVCITGVLNNWVSSHETYTNI